MDRVFSIYGQRPNGTIWLSNDSGSTSSYFYVSEFNENRFKMKVDNFKGKPLNV